MSQNQYPKHILDLMDDIERVLPANLDSCLEYVSKLEDYAQEVYSEYLMGFAWFYRGFVSYIKAELSDSMHYFALALHPLIAGENWKKAVKTYVAMGNIADYQGDVSLAINCYLKGLAMSQEQNLPALEHDLFCNIGNVYSSMNDSFNAEKMFRESERIRLSGADVDPVFTTIVEANLALCCARIGEYEQAEQRRQTLKEMMKSSSAAMDQSSKNMDHISLALLETMLYHGTGDIEKRDAAIKRLDDMELESMNVYDALDEFCQHANLLLEIGKTEEFLALVDRMETLATSPSAEKKTLELRLSYYEKIGDEEGFARMAVRYYKLARELEEERNKVVSHNITTRMHLEAEESRRKEAEKTNLMLKQKSERDALTGMNNRYKFNELAELAFDRAHRNGTPLAFEILDIDCYKEFNDNYGHQAGDDCLIRIADVIRSLEEFGGIHTARYGGDEFVIIYEDYSKQDVEEIAKRLQEMVCDLNIEHKFSKVKDYVTISQGLFHKIPSDENKPWDFLYGADMALYGVKYRAKNSFYVATSVDEALAYSNVER